MVYVVDRMTGFVIARTVKYIISQTCDPGRTALRPERSPGLSILLTRAASRLKTASDTALDGVAVAVAVDVGAGVDVAVGAGGAGGPPIGVGTNVGGAGGVAD